MHTKLTLRIEEDTIKKVKGEAHRRGKSVSQMVSEYFDLLENPVIEKIRLPPVTGSLLGILKEISEKDYHRHLKEKYL